MKQVSVIQHTAAEYLGLIEDHLEGRRIGFRYFRPFAAGGALPRVDELGDAVFLVGGGPWGAAGGRDWPLLAEEVALVSACLEARKPVVALGLGSEVLALAAGGAVEACAPSLELVEARRVDDDALNGFLPERFPLAVCLRDRPVPPGDARILAVDGQGAPVVFQVGRDAVAFTGHPGVKRGMVEDLVMEYLDLPDQVAAGLDALGAAQRAIEDALVGIMTGLIQVTRLMRPGGRIPFSVRGS